MEFQFAKYTDVTKLAFSLNPEYEANGYKKIYLCPDVHCVWIARIIEGYGEDYEEEKGKVMVEFEKDHHTYKSQDLTEARAIRILKEDGFENWDYHVFDSMEEAIEEAIDGGNGLIEEKGTSDDK